MKVKNIILVFVMLCLSFTVSAQVGSYRNDLSIGFNGGYMMSNIAFVPKVVQGMQGGKTFGFTARYVCEKYFNSICAIQVEANYSQSGWKEDIKSENDEPCILDATGEAAAYSRTLNYLQVPLLAHLGFGREESGMKFFINMGPQFGYLLSESTNTNFRVKGSGGPDALPYYSLVTPDRMSNVIAQDTMSVEHKMDYGIAAGLGVEFSMKRAGHIILEARYYYGLGNIYRDSKADYFARSNINSIIIKGTYLFDLIRTRNAKRK